MTSIFRVFLDHPSYSCTFHSIYIIQAASDLDVGLLLKLQTKVKVLERERELLRKKIEDLEEEGPIKPKSPGITNDSAFESLKVRFKLSLLYEPCNEKICFLRMRKQSRRSAAR